MGTLCLKLRFKTGYFIISYWLKFHKNFLKSVNVLDLRLPYLISVDFWQYKVKVFINVQARNDYLEGVLLYTPTAKKIERYF